ncbi:interleukin 17-like protein [Haliotis asinina]|uniref:interleukin 17-like protein n=1 Tax=Haliotis asinina TaxID=109174 RepID=UPI003531ED4D
MEAVQSTSSSRHFVKLLLTLMSCVTAQHTDCGAAGNDTELMARFKSLNPGTFVQYHRRGCPHDGGMTTDSTPTIPRCPTSLGDSSAATNDKALCPWTYRDEHYQGQFPPVLVQATCLCQRCVNNTGYSCAPVRYSIWVLQETGECRAGVKEYRKVQRDVTVGCTCVTPRTN